MHEHIKEDTELNMKRNVPEIKMGIIAVSRDCFIRTLSESRRVKVAEETRALGLDISEISVVVENERDAMKALEEAKAKGCNALCVFLGNFGPETPETLIAKYFDGPVMYAAAAEERGDNLVDGRGDAYCGMLNCSYNLNLRNIPAYIPEYPVGDSKAVARMIVDFVPVARAIIGLKKLKIITFGPRPQDFFACNAPIKGLYDIGVEIEENSELDLLVSYKAHEGDERIESVVKDMAEELGLEGNRYPDLLPRMAQFELTLLDWAESHKGEREFVVFADKCWPAFPEAFGFEPCYVNSRLASRGIPVACEVDIYGALSEYIGACITESPVTLLDINNTVPRDMYESEIKDKTGYKENDVFMGFHCGNTPLSCLSCGAVNYQIIQNRLLENGGEPDFTRGTLEGDIRSGEVTIFRLHANSDGSLEAYCAEGEVLPVATRSFGGIGIIAVDEMARFYRHVLIRKHFPHHTAVAFGHIGKAFYGVLDYLGVKDVSYNRGKGNLYPEECPF